ncbi:MAG: outer membrane protein transport protein [Pseudomonadales bacterium]|nr:outer membrane protein transport protein [Pseudomonadales bacterium]
MNKISKRSAPSRLRQLSALSLAVGAVVFSSTVNAQLTQNITIGNPKALGLAHAVTADPPGIDSIHFNPAGLAKIKGRQRIVKVLGAHMLIEGSIGVNQTPSETKTAFCGINAAGNAGDCSDQAFADSIWEQEVGTDQGIAGEKSSTTTPLLMLPGSGLTEIPFMIVPVGGIAIEDPNYGWTFATAAYSPMAIGYQRDSSERIAILDANGDDTGIGKRVGGDPGELQGQDISIARITYFSPSIGIQVTDELAIGASIGFSWHGFGIVTDFRAPLTTLAFLGDLEDDINQTEVDALAGLLSVINPYDFVGELTMEMEDALSLSFNVGLLWEPTEWISFGAVFQSEATADMEGDFKMVNTDEFVNTTSSLSHSNLDILVALTGDERFNAVKVEKGTVTSEQIVPAHIALGTSVKVFPNLKINVDVKWIEYSKWDELTFTFDGPADFLTLSSVVNAFIGEDNADSRELRIPRNYEDVVSWAIGAEYQYNDNLVFRMGYEPRGSAIPDDAVDLLVPLAESDLYSFGFGYQLDSYSRVDASIAYLHSEFSAGVGESKNANDTQEGQVVYNPYGGSAFSGSVDAYIFALSYEEKF